MRTVVVVGFLAGSAGVGACSAYTNLGDLIDTSTAGKGAEDDEPHTSGGIGASPNDPGGGFHYGGAPGSTQGGATSFGGTESGGADSGGADSGGADSGEAGSAQTAGADGDPGTGAYEPRSGPFKMLAYSATKGFRHDSIAAGKTMLAQIANEQGFELTVTEANTDITPAGLAKYEIVFFMNPTGDIFNEAEQKAFEEWMTQKNGAFAGTHSATDTEAGWAFYKEVTGQYYDLHDACCVTASVQWDPEQTNFIAVKGLPSPWQRSEEWYRFNSASSWTSKPGFKVLGRVTTPGGGTRPVSFIREWGNFRAFYTSIGHEAAAFRDANVKKHIAAGIMWAVRREALLK